MQLRGEVAKRVVARGSKSEREAVVLITADAEYVLRRTGGNAFADPELDALVGKTLRAEGTVHGYTFLMDRWQIES
jgi:hypothetical protein